MAVAMRSERMWRRSDQRRGGGGEQVRRQGIEGDAEKMMERVASLGRRLVM